jgi:hypothetical protein
MQDPSAVWSQQADPNQWASTYYGYGYDAYGYAQDPSYVYGAYAGYSQYPQQVRISIHIYIIIIYINSECLLYTSTFISKLWMWTPEAC